MTRAPLPNRRPSLGFEFTHGPIHYSAMASFDARTGQFTEVFLSGGKAGSEIEAMARDCAVIASLALQHGTPLDTIRRAITRLDDGKAAGPMGRMIDQLAEGFT